MGKVADIAGDTLGIDIIDFGKEALNIVDFADVIESPSEKEIRKQAEAEEARVKQAEADKEKALEIEREVEKDREALERARTDIETDETGVGLGEVVPVKQEEEDEVRKALSGFGRR